MRITKIGRNRIARRGCRRSVGSRGAGAREPREMVGDFGDASQQSACFVKRHVMVRIVRCLLILIAVVVVMFPNESHSGIRLADVGFQAGGLAEMVSPIGFDQYFNMYDTDEMTWVYGFDAAAVLPLGELFRASIGSGYFRSQRVEGLFVSPNATMPGAPAYYVVESVPLTGKVDYLATESVLVVTLGVAVEMHFLTVTQQIPSQSAAAQSGSTTVPGWSVNIGIEWPVNQRTFLGFGGGYRFAEGEAPYSRYMSPLDEKDRIDLSGPFATVLIRVHPWQRVSKD